MSSMNRSQQIRIRISDLPQCPECGALARHDMEHDDYGECTNAYWVCADGCGWGQTDHRPAPPEAGGQGRTRSDTRDDAGVFTVVCGFGILAFCCIVVYTFAAWAWRAML